MQIHVRMVTSVGQTWAILNKSEMMLTNEVLSAMVLKWKGTFERDELPIDGRYPDAVQDFMTWLEDQPYGYLVPHPGRMGVGDLPIYDVVVTPNLIG